MICLAFTRSRLLAGVKVNGVDLLSIKGKPFVEYEGREMLEVLKTNLSDIQFAYASYVRKFGMQMGSPIPTAIAFPDEYSLHGSKLARQVKEVVEVLEKEAFKKFSVVHLDHIGLSFAHSLIRDDVERKKTSILLEYEDSAIGLTYLNTNARLNGNKFLAIKEIGYEVGRKKLMETLIHQFERSGLKLELVDKTSLANQITDVSDDLDEKAEFSLTKVSGPVKIKADISIPSKTYYEAFAQNKEKLLTQLSEDQLSTLGVSKVLLKGSLLRNKVFSDYLAEQPQLNGLLLKKGNSGEEMEATIGGLAERAEIAIEIERRRKEEEERKRREEEERLRREEEERKRKARLEAERKAREEAERKRKEEEERLARIEAEKQAKINRDLLISNIQLQCVNPEQKEAYENLFIKEGAKLNIPAEVIKWTIEDALRSRELQTRPTQTTMPSQQMVAVPNQASNNAGSGEDLSNLPDLYNVFEVQAVLIDSEFSTKIVIRRDNGSRKVIRILERSLMADSKQISNFRKLYKKELKYFKQLSDIINTKEGMYYSRNYEESTSIKNYIRKIGIDRVGRFDKFTPNQLKFLLQVFREVRALEVSHAALGEDNIQVISSRRWNLQREVELRFSGFTSDDCSNSEMETKLHSIFSRLLDPSVYSEFRERYKL